MLTWVPAVTPVDFNTESCPFVTIFFRLLILVQKVIAVDFGTESHPFVSVDFVHPFVSSDFIAKNHPVV